MGTKAQRWQRTLQPLEEKKKTECDSSRLEVFRKSMKVYQKNCADAFWMGISFFCRGQLHQGFIITGWFKVRWRWTLYQKAFRHRCITSSQTLRVKNLSSEDSIWGSGRKKSFRTRCRSGPSELWDSGRRGMNRHGSLEKCFKVLFHISIWIECCLLN